MAKAKRKHAKPRRTSTHEVLTRLQNVATDEEADTIEDLACRAGIWWKCKAEGCHWVNPGERDRCEECMAARE